MAHSDRAALFIIASLLSACGSGDSPEAQVRRTIDTLETAAEARDVGDVMQVVSSDFRDAYGHGPEDIGRNLRGYFIANQSVHLLTRIGKIDFPASDEARLQMTVGMVGREADAAAAWDLAADLYDFDVTLRREDGQWKVTYAEWQRD
jgi:hypothetical protein